MGYRKNNPFAINYITLNIHNVTQKSVKLVQKLSPTTSKAFFLLYCCIYSNTVNFQLSFSAVKSVTRRIPQCSVLGLLLFILYSYCIVKVIKYCKCHIYNTCIRYIARSVYFTTYFSYKMHLPLVFSVSPDG